MKKAARRQLLDIRRISFILAHSSIELALHLQPLLLVRGQVRPDLILRVPAHVVVLRVLRVLRRVVVLPVVDHAPHGSLLEVVHGDVSGLLTIPSHIAVSLRVELLRTQDA